MNHRGTEAGRPESGVWDGVCWDVADTDILDAMTERWIGRGQPVSLSPGCRCRREVPSGAVALLDPVA